jgi:predicted metal-dependent HD superfamily phosphohydrolase
VDADASSRLQAGWVQLLTGLGAQPEAAGAAFAGLARRYGSAKRHYHTLEHIAAMLDALAQSGAPEAITPSVTLAVWLHDAVYDSRAADNEECSAALAEELLDVLRLPASLRTEVARLILLTKTHETGAEDAAGQLLLDADLAVLGAGANAYDRYSRDIRREFGWVGDDDFRVGRRKVLESFLHRPRIYLTPAFARLETAARENLRREIASLGGTKTT